MLCGTKTHAMARSRRSMRGPTKSKSSLGLPGSIDVERSGCVSGIMRQRRCNWVCYEVPTVGDETPCDDHFWHWLYTLGLQSNSKATFCHLARETSNAFVLSCSSPTWRLQQLLLLKLYCFSPLPFTGCLRRLVSSCPEQPNLMSVPPTAACEL